jgi:hypothetical protein
MRAVVRIPFQPRLQFHATHSSTASPVDQEGVEVVVAVAIQNGPGRY